jgi:hypothetical protein
MGDGGVKGYLRLVLIAGPILLAGCSSPRWAPKDYCKKQERQISKEERILFVLQEIAKREDEYRGVAFHFLSWRTAYKKAHRSVSEEDVATAYYKTAPSCCEVIPPAYLSRELLSDNDWDNGVEESLRRYPGFWVVDVRLPVKAPPPTSKRRPIEFERIGVSACNDKISSGGFWQ